MTGGPAKPDHPHALPEVSGPDDLTVSLLQQRALDAPSRPGLIAAIDRFEVLSMVGRGGMGIVLLARDPTTEARVAIKMLPPELAGDAQVVKRFLTEAKHMYRLDHPNILRVLEVSDRATGPYYVMPYKERGSLARLIRPGEALDEASTLRIARQTAEALAFAHRQGLIHRDVKPHNVLLDPDERAYLADFGLVRTVYNDSMVEPGHEGRRGTLAYMSPAVAHGEAEDTRCDIYSFGAMLYEMLTGEPPYQGQTREAIICAILSVPPVPIRQRNPSASVELSNIAEGCMARELRDRYATMDDVRRDLERVAGGQPALGPHGMLKLGGPRRGLWLAAAAVAVVLIGALAIWRPWSRPDGADRSSDAPSLAVLAQPHDGDSPEVARARKAVELAPNSPESWTRLSRALWREKSPDAVEAGRKAVELAPESPAAWRELGHSYEVLMLWERAAEAWEKVIELAPEDAYHWTHLCDAQLWGGHADQAVEACRRSVELEADSEHAYYGWGRLGLALEQVGQFEEAVAALEHAITLKPDLSYEREALQRIQSRLKTGTSTPSIGNTGKNP